MMFFPTLRQIYDDVVLAFKIRNNLFSLRDIRRFGVADLMIFQSNDRKHGFAIQVDLAELQMKVNTLLRDQEKKLQSEVDLAMKSSSESSVQIQDNQAPTDKRPGWSPELKARVKARKALAKKIKDGEVQP